MPKYKKTKEGLTRQDAWNCGQLVGRPGFHGPKHRGHMKCVRKAKRVEAKIRGNRTNGINDQRTEQTD